MEALSDVADVDDEVVASLDVFVSQPPAGRELYVLDYPTRAVAAPIGQDRAVEGVRLRRVNQRVELTLSLFPRGLAGVSDASFDFSRSERAGVEAPTTQVLESARPPRPPVNYGAGTYVPPADGLGPGSVVLAPVHTVARMRPSFAHIDEADSRVHEQKALAKAAKDKEKGNLDADAGADRNGDNAELEVEMKFTRRESERVAERRKNSLAAILKHEETDPWISLDYVDASHPQVAITRDQIFQKGSSEIATGKMEDELETTAGTSSIANGRGSSAGGAPKSYMDRLYEHAPSIDNVRRRSRVDALSAAGGTMPAVPMRALRAERPEAAVQALVGTARIVQFDVLRECVRKSMSDGDLLVVVRKAAFLLRGCWVCKTPRRLSRRYVGSRMPPRVPAGRTVVLDLFRRSRIVRTDDVFKESFSGVVPLDEESIMDFLGEVAERRKGVGWVFKLDDDKDFQISNPVVANEEEDAWDSRVADARRVLSAGANPGRASGSSANPRSASRRR